MSHKFQTMVDALDYRAREEADAQAFIFRDRGHVRHSLTWADLYRLAGRFSGVLREGGFQELADHSSRAGAAACEGNSGSVSTDMQTRGSSSVGRGDLVVNTLPNSPERVVCEAGVMLSGAASVNGQCLMADGSDLLRTLRVSRAKAILLDPDVTDSPWRVLRRHVTLRHDHIVTSSPSLRLDDIVTSSPSLRLDDIVTSSPSLRLDDIVMSSQSLPELRKVYMVRRGDDDDEGKGQSGFLTTLESLPSSAWFKSDSVTPEDTLTVFTTSGSSGFSKLVETTHGYFTGPRTSFAALGEPGGGEGEDRGERPPPATVVSETLKTPTGTAPETLKPTGTAPETLNTPTGTAPETLNLPTGKAPETLNTPSGTAPETLNTSTGTAPETLNTPSRGSGTDTTPRQFNLSPLGWIGGCLYRSLVSGHTRVLCDVRAGGFPHDMAEFILRSILDERCTSAYFSPKYLPQLMQKIVGGGGRQKNSDDAGTPGNDDDWKIGGKQKYSNDGGKRGVDTDGDGAAEGMGEVRLKLAGEGVGATSMSKLQTLYLGGMPVNRGMVRAGLAIADSVVVGYGATEFGLVSGLRVNDWKSYVDHDTGPPAHGVRVKIVSLEDESVGELPVGQVGQILIKHPNMPKGYLHDPQATADLFTDDGFVRTGDVGRLDEKRHLIVEGRGSDAIMRGPNVHYPHWLESRIRACPLVRDVIVVGVPDPFLNEELCACVVLHSERQALPQTERPSVALKSERPELQELESEEVDNERDEELISRALLKEVEQWLEHDIVVSEDDPLCPRPRYYLSFPSLPQTSTDKLRRRHLKKLAAERLELTLV